MQQQPHQHSGDSVLAVVVNWRRKDNIPKILEALRAQDYPLSIAIFDNARGTEFELSTKVLDGFDFVWTCNQNLGAACRFIPSMALPQFKYTFFTLDDHLPGPMCLSWLLATARQLDDKFATIGQDGRRIEGDVLVKKRVRMSTEPVKCDVIVSYELAKTADVAYAAIFRAKLLERFPDISIAEEDMLLCFGLQYYTGYPTYLTPFLSDERQTWKHPLPSPHALCDRPTHQEGRNNFVRCAREFGWRSLC